MPGFQSKVFYYEFLFYELIIFFTVSFKNGRTSVSNQGFLLCQIRLRGEGCTLWDNESLLCANSRKENDME